METNDSAVELAFQMGAVLLENGAEISRVQETAERVAKAFGVDNMGVYVLTNALFASGDEKKDLRKTAIKFVRSSSIHFGRICAVNELSREIEAGKYTISDAFKELERIKEIPNVSNSLLVVSSAVGCACFCYMFGGTVLDSLAALIIGALLELIIICSEKSKLSRIFVNLCLSSFAAVAALLLIKLGIGENSEAIIAGAVIRLVPGVALTTAIRDFFNSDYLSGTIRMIDAMLVGGSIAVGVGIVFKAAAMLGIL